MSTSLPCDVPDCNLRVGGAFAALPEIVNAPVFDCRKCGKQFRRDADGQWRHEAAIVKFEPVTVGEGYRFDPDELLDAAKGQGFTRLAILAEKPDGGLWVSGTANAGETIILIELAKHQIIHGDT